MLYDLNYSVYPQLILTAYLLICELRQRTTTHSAYSPFIPKEHKSHGNECHSFNSAL